MVDPIDIKTMDFGYLMGIDLIQYLPEYYLEAVYDKNADSLQRAVHIAKSRVQNYLAALYDLSAEYQKTGWDRNGVVLKLVIFCACWEIASGDEAIKKSLTDAYQDFLRCTVAYAGNDHRLGANEAPPAVVSMFLGTELTEILDAIESDTAYDAKEKELLKIGVHVLPKFPKDTTDRNRTSPFAFTGNKFEFRMLGSAASISDANVVLNTAVAESLRQYADVLEQAEDFETALHDLIRNTIQAHKRIIFNGNGYDASWLEEAEKRGLLNLKTTPDCVPYLLKEKNVRLFTTHKIYSETELHARYEIMLENYSKVLRIEALTMLEMVNTDILPAVSDYTAKLVRTAEDKKALLGSAAGGYEQKTAARLSSLTEIASEDAAKLDDALLQAGDLPTAQEAASFYQAEVFKDMTELRLAVDEMETLTSRACWPYPSYGDLLFSVR